MCLHGARAVRASILNNASIKNLRTIVVWIPMLDNDELPAAQEASGKLVGVPQFWDGTQLLGHEVARSVGAPEWIAWDVYLFYPPGTEWTDRGLPVPEAALAQAGGVVVGTKGTLPALADQSHLPRKLQGRAEVVGAQSNLEALLAKVGESFAARYQHR
ncbi:MAG: hypothetical protein ABIY55_34515 [Kofleriaceae bacterium]